jgi:succinate-semialdehyde dehydrogenase/glutarate-semialdehyde dehydrogenase
MRWTDMVIKTIPRELLWINGARVESAGAQYYVVSDPYSGKANCEVALADARDADLAAAAAAAAFKSWSRLSGNARANVIYKAYHLLRDNKKELENILVQDLGKTIKEAEKEVRSTGAFIRFYAEQARRLQGDYVPSPDTNKKVVAIPMPVGPVLAITAANAPGILFGRKVAPAIAAGCTVVLKPAEETARFSLLLAELFSKAGLPNGVINVIAGKAPEIVSSLIADKRIQMVTFTGSVTVGKQIMRLASERPIRVLLELGGVAPFLVFHDADLDLAADGLIKAKFRHSGQICASPQRALIQMSVYDEFKSRLFAKLAQVKFGNPADPQTLYGPVQNERIATKIFELLDDAISKGATIAYGNKARNGLLMEPVVLENVSSSMLVCREEAFGPVITLEPFETEEEAVEKANATDYGLGAYVFTKDLARAWRVSEALEAGIVGINDPFPATVEGPFGGVKHSGFGVEGGHYGIEQFMIKKQVSFLI